MSWCCSRYLITHSCMLHTVWRQGENRERASSSWNDISIRLICAVKGRWKTPPIVYSLNQTMLTKFICKPYPRKISEIWHTLQVARQLTTPSAISRAMASSTIKVSWLLASNPDSRLAGYLTSYTLIFTSPAACR